MSSAVPERSFDRGVALLVAAAFFMEILDATIIGPAIPHIASSLGVDPIDVNVAISAYLVTVAVGIPASGWLADRLGIRKVFLAAILVFVAASVVCALSTSLPMLVAARILQGIGGAMMVPVGRLAVLRYTEKRDLVHAIALLTWPALLAPVLAPALGGAIVTVWSWSGIFLINVPIGIVGFVLSTRLVRDDGVRTRRRLDWFGFAALAAAIALALVALEDIRTSGTEWAHVVGGLAAAAVLMTGAVVHLRRTPHPLVDLGVLRIATLRITVSGGALYRAVITALPFLLPLQFQLVFGWTPLWAGLAVAALFAGNIAIKPATTPLMRRFGIRTVLLVNAIMSAGCYGLLALMSPAMPAAVVVVILFLSGALRSIGFTAYNTLAFSEVDAEQLTHANTLNAAVQEVASGVGVAIAALIVAVLSGVAVATGHPAATAYPWTYLVLGALMVLTTVETLLLPRDAGAAQTGTAA
jgi:EmrB/QacA subfamily drug resistance transporter